VVRSAAGAACVRVSPSLMTKENLWSYLITAARYCLVPAAR
jgi:hypothetical protein